MNKGIELSEKSINRNVNIKLFGLYFLIILIGACAIFLQVRTAQNLLKQDLCNSAKVVKYGLSVHEIQQLTATASDSLKTEYQSLKGHLSLFRKSIPKCRFIYLVSKKQDSIVFLVDSEPADSKDYSPPGQIYSEACADLFNVFKTKQNLIEGPETDRWGTWVTVYEPIVDSKTGEVLAVLGVDISSKDWNNLVAKESKIPILLICVVLLLVFFSFSMGRKAHQSKLFAQFVKESESKFRTMFQQHTAVMLLVDPVHETIEDANDAAARFYGYTISELQTLTLSDIYITDVNRITDQGVLQSKADLEFYSKQKTAKGQIKSVQTLMSPYNTHEGTFMFLIINDVTEKEDIQKQIAITEERFSEFAKAVDTVFILKSKEKVLYVNQQFELLFGISCDFLYKNPNAFIPYIDKNDRHYFGNDGSGKADYFPTEPQSFECRVVKPNGELHWVWIKTFPIFSVNGKVEKVAMVLSDITEKKKIVEQVIQATDNFESIFKASPDALIICNAAGLEITDSNDQFLTFSGYQKSEISGLSLPDLNVFNDGEEFLELIYALKSKGFFSNKHFILKNKYGRNIDSIVSSKVIQLNSEPHYIISIRDIADIKQIENKLKISEENFRILFDSIDEFVFVLDLRGSIITCNSAVERKLGYKLNEIKGYSAISLRPKHLQEEAMELFTKAVIGEIEYCSLPILTKDGKEIPSETRVYTGKWDGMPSLFTVTKDLSSVKKSEERFVKAFESGSVVMCISEVESGKIININNAFTTCLGFTKNELQGKTIYDLNLFNDFRLRRAIVQEVKDRSSIHDVELSFKTKMGEERTGIFSVTLFDIESVPCWLTTMVDITDRKIAEQQAIESHKQWEAILASSPDGIGLASLDGTLQFMSDNLIEMFGYTKEEAAGFIGMPFLQFLDKSCHEQAQENYKKVITGEAKNSISEYVAVKKDGSRFFIETNTSLQFDAKGKPYSVLFIQRDISDRKQIENIAKQNEEQLMRILDSQEVGILVIEEDSHQIQFVNNKGASIIGLDKNHIIGKMCRGFICNHSANDCMFNCEENVIQNKERYIVNSNGENIPVLKSVVKELFNGKQCLIESFVDISERQSMENSIRYQFEFNSLISGISERLLQTDMAHVDKEITNSLQQLVSFMDINSSFVYELQNDTDMLLLTYSCRQTVNNNTKQKTKFSSIPYWHKAFLNHEYIFIPNVQELSDNRQNEKHAIIPRETVSLLAIPMHYNSNLVGIVIFTTTEDTKDWGFDEVLQLKMYANIVAGVLYRKNIEQTLLKVTTRLSLATRAGGVGVWDLNLETNEVFWDEQMFSLYEIDGNTISFEQWMNVIDESEKEKVLDSISNSIQNKSEINSTYTISTKTGNKKFIRSLAIPQINEDGKVYRLIGTNWDVTHEKHNEALLIQTKEHAIAANIAKSDFLATMSHEIRTPLNGVIGFSDILMKTPLDEKQMEYMSNVYQSANSLLDLVNDILDFSKIEAGKLELCPEEIDLHELLESVISVTKFKINEKGLETLLSIPEHLPRWIVVDPVRLRQVLINLLGNAAKFTEQGEVELKIEMFDSANENEKTFIFSVRDTGIGISESKQQEIFESFSQADSSTTRKYGGTGLGLTISSNLVKKMGSTLRVESKVEKGSMFYFSITTECRYDESTQSEQFNFKRILIVDDNESNKRILQTILKTMDITSEYASNGLMALEKLEQKTDFDVVFIDYEMPYVDGLQVVENFYKLNNPNNPTFVLMHNSFDIKNAKALCDKLNIKHILQKPITRKNIRNTLLKIKIGDELIQEISEKKENTLESINEDEITVLIVDDNRMNLNLASSLIHLNIPKANIFTTQISSEACTLYLKHKPQLVLLDIQMPDKNGYEVAADIRATVEDYKNPVPIIALTAGTLAGEKERCLQAGMNDYLSKPMSSSKLFSIIEKYIKGNKTVEISNYDTKEKTNLVHYDKDETYRIYDHNEAFVNRLIVMAFDSMPQYIEALETSLNTNDKQLIKYNAHTLKGVARGVGFNILEDLCVAVENNYQTNVDECMLIVEQIKAEHDYLHKMFF